MYGPRSPTSSGHTAPKKLLEKSQPMDQPVDNFMAWEAREGRLEAYVLLDDGDTDDTWSGGIVTQLDFNGDSDIKKSDGGDQGDDPTAYLAKKPEQQEGNEEMAKEALAQDTAAEAVVRDSVAGKEAAEGSASEQVAEEDVAEDAPEENAMEDVGADA